MFNKTLFITTLKANWTILLYIILICMIYIVTSVTMFNPDTPEFTETMLQLLPKNMLEAFGFTNMGTNLTSYLAGYLYGFILLVFPFIYTAIIANRLIAKHVDSGSMACLLSTPNTRVRIASTQAIYLFTSTIALYAVIYSAALILSVSIWPGLLDMGLYAVLNLVTLSTALVSASLGFLSSCVFSDTRRSTAFGAGVPLVMIVLKMVSGISDKIEWLKYFTVYSLIDVNRILEGGTYSLFATIILLSVSIVLFASGIIVFNKKSLII